MIDQDQGARLRGVRAAGANPSDDGNSGGRVQKVGVGSSANSLDDGPQASLDTYEPTAYLVDDVEDVADLPRLEKALWRRIFEHQLASWDRDPGNWPRHRNRLAFRQWFDLDLHPMVLDVGAGTIDPI